jgi:protein-arginine kinase activator protein McsA
MCVCVCVYIKVSSDTKIYLTIKKIIIIIHAKRRVYCRKIFTEFNIFPPAAKYFCKCYNFLCINWKHIEPNVNLSKHQAGVYYHVIKVFGNLQPTIKTLNDINILKPALKGYLLSHSFYSV